MAFCEWYAKDEFACLKCEYVADHLCKMEIKPKRKKSNPDYIKTKSRNYRQNNKDKCRDSERKCKRKKIIISGTANLVGYTIIDSEKIAIYEGKKEPLYYCLINEQIKEFTVNEMIGKWIKGD